LQAGLCEGTKELVKRKTSSKRSVLNKVTHRTARGEGGTRSAVGLAR